MFIAVGTLERFNEKIRSENVTTMRTECINRMTVNTANNEKKREYLTIRFWYIIFEYIKHAGVYRTKTEM